MIGNVIQSAYLDIKDYPIAAALSFIMMALIVAPVAIYIKFAGSESLMGDEAEVVTAVRPQLATRTRRDDLRDPRRALHAAADLGDRAFSFNRPGRQVQLHLAGLHVRPLEQRFRHPGSEHAMMTSLELAALATIFSTILGTMIALALVRHQFRGRRMANLLIVIPMTSPEVVIGAALLSMFVYAQVTTGFATLLIAHVMFSISFVVVVVRSRLIGFDRRLEEAARDLGADTLTTFRTVTLPLIAPGLAAAALLAFALSLDDFVISNFNSGTTVTFPLYIFGAAQRGIPVAGQRARNDALPGHDRGDGLRGRPAAPRREARGDPTRSGGRGRNIRRSHGGSRRRLRDRRPSRPGAPLLGG